MFFQCALITLFFVASISPAIFAEPKGGERPEMTSMERMEKAKATRDYLYKERDEILIETIRLLKKIAREDSDKEKADKLEKRMITLEKLQENFRDEMNRAFRARKEGMAKMREQRQNHMKQKMQMQQLMQEQKQSQEAPQ